MRDDILLGADVVNPNFLSVDAGIQRCPFPKGLNEAFVNGERANARRNVPAISLVSYCVIPHSDLDESITDVSVWAVRRFNDSYLRSNSFGATKAIYLDRVWRSHDLQDVLRRRKSAKNVGP